MLRLAEHLNSANPAMVGLLGRATAVETAAGGGDAVHGHAAALRQLWSLVMRQAQTQTYADAFLAIMACFAVAILAVPRLREAAAPSRRPLRRIDGGAWLFRSAPRTPYMSLP